MPPLHLVLHPDSHTLLEAAADAANSYRMDGILLALRQGGIRDDLYQMAGAAGHPGWFDPPACTFKELRERLGGTDRVPLTPDERLVLLDRLVREHGGTIFGQLKRRVEFLDSIDTVIGELVGADVSPEAFHQAATSTATVEPWDRDRNLALAAIYQAWHDTLEASTPARRDGRDDLIDVARHLAADPGAVAARLGGRTDLRIIGLADLRGGWRTLLHALRHCPAFTQITIHALDRHLLDEGLECDQVSGESAAADALPHPAVIRAPDTDREVEEVAVRVRRLLDDGVPAHRVAVVSRSARPHLDLMLTALRRLGVPATARRRIGFRQIPAVRGVLALFQAAAEGWTRHGLAELAAHPAMANELDGRIIDLIGFRRATMGLGQWREAFDALVQEAVARETGDDDGDYRGWLPPTEHATQARDRFAAFAERAGHLDATRPLSEWIAWLGEFLASDPWQMVARSRDVPAEEWEVVRVDLAGWDALTTAVDSWRRALDAWGSDDSAIDAAGFASRLSGVLRGDATLWTSCRRGVLVTEAHGAAYRHFEHLFVVGLESRVFPQAAPSSPILHRDDKAALHASGLPLDLAHNWEARERSLFHALRAGGAAVTLSHAVLDAAGREVVPSVFLDAMPHATPEEIPPRRVLTPGMPLVPDADTARHALANARIEVLRGTGQPSPWNGTIEDTELRGWLAQRFGESYMWSPTQLEGYAKCPWSWFSSRVLGLDEQAEPEAELDPTVRGTLWHAALELFWNRAMERLHAEGRTGEGLMLRADDLPWAGPMLEAAFDSTWTTEGESSWLGEPALHDTTRAQLRATLRDYLTWEVELNDEAINNARKKIHKQFRTAVSAHELGFKGVVLERHGVRFQYRGTIDRVEVGVDERVADAGRYLAAVDYKSGKYSTPGGGKAKAWEDGVVLQVPLYAHAIAQLKGQEVARVEYRAIRHQETAHSLELVRFTGNKKDGLELTPDADAAARMEAALDAAVDHVARVRQGEYPARTVESCKCPSFCHAWDICRIAGGPESAW